MDTEFIERIVAAISARVNRRTEFHMWWICALMIASVIATVMIFKSGDSSDGKA